MTAPRTEIDGWYRTTPSRRPRSDAEVALPQKPMPFNRNLFTGLFRRKMAERQLAGIQSLLQKLDETLAKENYLAVTAAHYQFAVEAARRIKRPDLVKEFEEERDRAVLAARSAKPLRQRRPSV